MSENPHKDLDDVNEFHLRESKFDPSENKDRKETTKTRIFSCSSSTNRSIDRSRENRERENLRRKFSI